MPGVVFVWFRRVMCVFVVFVWGVFWRLCSFVWRSVFVRFCLVRFVCMMRFVGLRGDCYFLFLRRA